MGSVKSKINTIGMMSYWNPQKKKDLLLRSKVQKLGMYRRQRQQSFIQIQAVVNKQWFTNDTICHGWCLSICRQNYANEIQSKMHFNLLI